MYTEYHSDPSDCIAVTGPHIGACCFSVGGDVADMFIKRYAEVSFIYEREKRYIDLSGYIGYQLRAAGIPERNIHELNMCTACNPDLFFSHRASGGNTGGMAAFMALL